MIIMSKKPSLALRGFGRLAHRLRSCAALLVAAVLPWPSAHAHDRDIAVKVEPLQPNAVYSRAATATLPAQTLYVGYSVTIKNLEDGPLTNVRFVGTTGVTEPTEKAVFSTALGASCTADAAGTTVSCAVGTLNKWQAVSFNVFFTTPIDTTALPPGNLANCAATDCIRFSGKTYYTESPSHYGLPSAESQAWSAAFVPLALPDPNKVVSAVPPTGATLYTGNGAVPVTNAPFATQIDVPPGYTAPAGQLPTASIVQTPDPQNCVSFYDCFRSQVTLPGTIAPYLTIVLRVDAANVKPRVKIDGVLVTYDGAPVGDCASPTTPRSDGFPCIAARKVYPSGDKHKHQRGVGHEHHDDDDAGDLAGDFEWTLINLKNGSYKIF